MRHNKYSSFTSFLDMLFTCLLGVTILLVLAIVSMANKAKSGDIPAHAEFMVILEWDPKSQNDIDLYLQIPNQKIVYFRNKTDSGVFLDRDDLGSRNDVFVWENGEVKYIDINREVISIRGIFPGTYTANVHYYSKQGPTTEEALKITLIKINPYHVIIEKELLLELPGQELTAFTFTIDSRGHINDINTYYRPLVKVQR